MTARSEILLGFLFPNFTRPNQSRFLSIFSPLRSKNESPTKKNKSFQIFLEKIMKGEDKRTSVMIKNLPNDVTKEYISELLADVGNINFLFLPYDKHSGKSLGFAFVNLVNYKYIIQLYNKLNGLKLEEFDMKRPLEVCYSKTQGKQGLSQMFGKKQ